VCRPWLGDQALLRRVDDVTGGVALGETRPWWTRRDRRIAFAASCATHEPGPGCSM
jgi:hypothetical protein